MQPYRCNWNWCREKFSNPRDLAHHLNHTHLNNLTKVKKDDWSSWVKTQTGEGQPDSLRLFDDIPNEASHSNAEPSASSSPHASHTPEPSTSRAATLSPPASSPQNVPDDETPLSRRRQSFSDYNMLSSPSPPLPSAQPSPTLSSMITGMPEDSRNPVAGPSRQRDFRASDSSVDDVEMQLTQGQSPSSSHGSFSVPEHQASAGPSAHTNGKTGTLPSKLVWQEGSFKMKQRSHAPFDLKPATVSPPQSRYSPQVASPQPQADSQGSARGTGKGYVGFSQMVLQTQAPYLSQSLDTQGDSQ